MLVTTAVFPIYFKAVALKGGISSADSTAYWGYANSFSTLIIAVLAPLLGALADYPHAKRRWLNVFTWLGIITAVILGVLPASGTLAYHCLRDFQHGLFWQQSFLRQLLNERGR